jgi:hypothetical protein
MAVNKTQIIIQQPRRTEAVTEPPMTSSMSVRPRFYRRLGLQTVLYLHMIKPNGDTDEYQLLINAGNGNLKLEKLTEVVPALEDPTVADKEEIEDGDKAPQD